MAASTNSRFAPVRAASFAALREQDKEMSTGAMWGWIGGIADGIIRTYFSIKNDEMNEDLRR